MFLIIIPDRTKFWFSIFFDGKRFLTSRALHIFQIFTQLVVIFFTALIDKATFGAAVIIDHDIPSMRPFTAHASFSQTTGQVAQFSVFGGHGVQAPIH